MKFIFYKAVNIFFSPQNFWKLILLLTFFAFVLTGPPSITLQDTLVLLVIETICASFYCNHTFHRDVTITFKTTSFLRVWNYNDESGFSQVLHLDTPKSLVPGSESGQLLVVGGLALPEPGKKQHDVAELVESVSSLASVMKLKKLGAKANESERSALLEDLPNEVCNVMSKIKVRVDPPGKYVKERLHSLPSTP